VLVLGVRRPSLNRDPQPRQITVDQQERDRADDDPGRALIGPPQVGGELAGAAQQPLQDAFVEGGRRVSPAT
jgi:hypothetical protein